MNHPTDVYFGGANFRSLDEMLYDVGTVVYPEDRLNVFPDPKIGIGSKITIERALAVQLTDAKITKTYRTWVETIGDLLREKKIELLGQDSAEPGVETKLSPNMKVKITRVAEVEEAQTEVINYQTKKQYDNTLEKGYKKVTQKGINGEKKVTYKIKRVDGQEVSREKINSEITTKPQDEITIIGTKIIVYGTGKASWYGRNATMVAASNTLAKGSLVKVVSLASGKSVVVEIDDTGIQTDAIIDLSDDAFAALAPLGAGIINVRVEKYYP